MFYLLTISYNLNFFILSNVKDSLDKNSLNKIRLNLGTVILMTVNYDSSKAQI